MHHFLYQFFLRQMKGRQKQKMGVFPDAPKESLERGKNIRDKEYRIFSPIPLPKGTGKLLEIAHMASADLFNNQITLDTVSYLLKCGFELPSKREALGQREPHSIPSDRNHSPLEIYIFCFQDTEDLCAGVYHYGTKEHVLEPVIQTEFSAQDLSLFLKQDAAQDAHGIIVITAVFERTTEKYGGRAYRYVLIEAGQVAENICLAGAEQGAAIIPIGDINEDSIERFIGLNSAHERVVRVLYF